MLFPMFFFGLMGWLIVILFVLVFSHSPPPMWMMYPLPFLLVGILASQAIEAIDRAKFRSDKNYRRR